MVQDRSAGMRPARQRKKTAYAARFGAGICQDMCFDCCRDASDCGVKAADVL